MNKFLIGAALSLSCVLNLPAVEVGTASEFAAALSGTDPITLMADLDLSTWSTVDVTGPLVLDGNGKKISGLTVPLLGAVTGGATITDLTFEGCSVSAASGDIAVLAKTMKSGAYEVKDILFSGCSVYKKSSGAGALVVGVLETPTTALIENCVADETCQVTADAGATAVASIAGSVTANGDGAEATVSRCVNNGLITMKGYTLKAAGIVCNAKAMMAKYTHLAYVNIYDCTNHSDLSFSGANGNTGGIVWSAEAGTDSANGFIRVRRCSNYGNIYLKSAQNPVGGIVGNTRYGGLEVSDCVNFGSVSAASQSAGGIIGAVREVIKDTVTITGCANLGAVDGMDAGGIVGELKRSSTGSYWVDVSFLSCFNRGALMSHREGSGPGEIYGYTSVAAAIRKVEVAGCLVQSNVLAGGSIAGASITEEIITDNVNASTSEGLVSGADLTALNAFGENCNLWKQGTLTPILKIMPDETVPDTVTVTFKDAEDFASVVLKTSVISRGGNAYAPKTPEHEGYTFLGWSPEDFTGVAEDLVIVATYQSGKIEHVVRFYDYDRTQIGFDQMVDHGKSAEAPSDPVREGYLFIGWDVSFDEVTADLDVTATYVRLVQEVGTAEDLTTALSAAVHPEVTYRLTADITLPSDWTSVDFIASFDGDGHVISYAGSAPIFGRLQGAAGNFILDGLVEETPTSITGINARFGLVAVSCLGGRISDVTLRNYQLHVLNAATGQTMGFICGQAGDGAVVERCTVEASCQFQTRSCTIGGIVGSATMSDAWSGEEPLLLAIDSCTNLADIVTFSSGGGRLAGVLADCSVNSTTRFPDVIVTNCVNRGKFRMAYAAGAEGRIGGIVAQRDANVANGVPCGTLTIVDCANYGDIDCIGRGFNTQNNSTVCSYGGILAYSYRLGAVTILRCQNRGRVSNLVAPDGGDLNGGMAGGIVGELRDVYTARPVTVTDCANYGAVNGGQAGGGLIGFASFNQDYTDIRVTSENSANYGVVSVGMETGTAGEWIGSLNSTTRYPDRIELGAWNCFFLTDKLVGVEGEGLPIHKEGNAVMSSEGYSCQVAKKALSSWAEGQEGFGTWIIGAQGQVLYPELKGFCEKPYSAFFIVIR